MTIGEIGSIRKALQDALAPELGAIKADLVALHQEVALRGDATQKQIDQRFTAEREHNDQKFKAEREHTDQRFDQVDKQFKAEREHTDQRFDAIMAEFRNQRQHSDLQTRTILEAYSSFIAQNDLSSVRTVVTDLMIRVAVLESRVLGSSKAIEAGTSQ